jgi:tocopherol O-methyltransferase
MQSNRESELLRDKIIRYYEVCDTDYAFFWHLNSHMAMHYGFWTNGTKDLKEALWNMNDLLAGRAGLREGDLVLDAGCGIGGSCFYIAGKYGCNMHGITLSGKHVSQANERALELKITDKVSFSVNDFCNSNFDNAAFTCVWALESVCHAADKSAFVREAYRLLKPGGRLVVGDFFQTADLPAEGKNKMRQWAESWAVPFFETAENFGAMLHEAGFAQVSNEDISRNIDRSSAILNRYFIPGLLSNWIMPIFGKRKSVVQKLNVWSVRHQRTTFKKGYWKYRIFSAVKQ